MKINAKRLARFQPVDFDPATIDLVVTDLIMPGSITGKELARRLQEQNPTTKVRAIPREDPPSKP